MLCASTNNQARSFPSTQTRSKCQPLRLLLPRGAGCWRCCRRLRASWRQELPTSQGAAAVDEVVAVGAVDAEDAAVLVADLASASSAILTNQPAFDHGGGADFCTGGAGAPLTNRATAAACRRLLPTCPAGAAPSTFHVRIPSGHLIRYARGSSPSTFTGLLEGPSQEKPGTFPGLPGALPPAPLQVCWRIRTDLCRGGKSKLVLPFQVHTHPPFQGVESRAFPGG